MYTKNDFIKSMTRLIHTVLEKKNLLNGFWHHGIVANVKAGNRLDLYIDGSNFITPNVPCNPDVTFNVGDNVFVIYINGRGIDKFVPYKKAIG